MRALQNRRRRRILATTTIGLIATGAFVAAPGVDESDTGVTDTTDAPENSRVGGGELIAADQRDLIRSQDFDATIGHGEPSKLRLGGEGTITRLPAVGDVIEFGQSVLEVNGEIVIHLQGGRPAWRALGPGVKGEDVRQMEAALVVMGYADPADIDVDDTWTSATTTAVKLMQKSLHMPIDGRLEMTEMVFGTDPLRIAKIAGGLGDPLSAAGIETSVLNQSIDLSMSASKAHLVDVGDSVDIEVPSGEIFDGTVESVGAPETSGDGKKTVAVSISTEVLDLPDGTPVTITVNIVAVSDATAVPAAALLALAEGGYAVEVPESSSATGTRLVRVEIGEFANGWVEVTGDIAPGDQVVVP